MKWFFCIFLTFSAVFVSIFGVRVVYAHLFPIKFEKEIAAACEQYDVPQAVVFSVINVESKFNKNAVSTKGAMGLMQVMPTTAKGLTDQPFDLLNPTENIQLGTKYLSQLISRFKNLQTAVAAYNAGPTVVKSWLSNEEYSEDGVTLKKIPYKETRGYVKKFNRNLKYYKQKV